MRDGHGAMVGRDGHGVLHLNIVPCTLYAAHYEGIPCACISIWFTCYRFCCNHKGIPLEVIRHAFLQSDVEVLDCWLNACVLGSSSDLRGLL